jgi:DNA-directed RNA polymerase specialized sigma24 family protein
MQRFEQIYSEHREAVRAYVRRRAPEDVVEDIVADTFLVCLRRLDRVPRDPLPWLDAVARKTLANERRKRARRASLHGVLLGEPAPAGDGALAAAATVLGCTAVACRVRYHRAKSRLASRLAAAASFRPEPKGVIR